MLQRYHHLADRLHDAQLLPTYPVHLPVQLCAGADSDLSDANHSHRSPNAEPTAMAGITVTAAASNPANAPDRINRLSEANAVRHDGGAGLATHQSASHQLNAGDDCPGCHGDAEKQSSVLDKTYRQCKQAGRYSREWQSLQQHCLFAGWMHKPERLENFTV